MFMFPFAEFIGNCSTDSDKSSTASEGHQAGVVDKREMLDQQMEMAKYVSSLTI